MLLENVKAIVTGGGRGIGRSIALAFAREGADVCITARTESEITEVAEEIWNLGRISLAIAADVTDRKAVDNVVREALDSFGQIDVLVNNAGGSIENKPIVESDLDNWIGTIEANLIGTYLFSRAVLPHMIGRRSGKIINVGSGMGHYAHPQVGNSAYAVSKAGVWMFTQKLATEVWQDGIDVNEIVPGPVETKMTQSNFKVGGPAPYAESERVKSPDEVAPLAVLLASRPAGGPTGQYFSLARRPI